MPCLPGEWLSQCGPCTWRCRRGGHARGELPLAVQLGRHAGTASTVVALASRSLACCFPLTHEGGVEAHLWLDLVRPCLPDLPGDARERTADTTLPRPASTACTVAAQIAVFLACFHFSKHEVKGGARRICGWTVRHHNLVIKPPFAACELLSVCVVRGSLSRQAMLCCLH